MHHAGSGTPPAAFPWAVPLNAIRGIAVDGTLEELGRRLESMTDRPVLIDTKLEGDYSFHVTVPRDAKNDFLDRLRDQAGIAITPAQRSAEILVLRPR